MQPIVGHLAWGTRLVRRGMWTQEKLTDSGTGLSIKLLGNVEEVQRALLKNEQQRVRPTRPGRHATYVALVHHISVSCPRESRVAGNIPFRVWCWAGSQSSQSQAQAQARSLSLPESPCGPKEPETSVHILLWVIASVREERKCW